MASAAGAITRLARVAGPAAVPAILYGAYKQNAVAAIEAFFTGPGRTSRIVALVVVLWNWKSLPLAWTYRVINGMISHLLVRNLHTYTPDKLFQPIKTETHVTLLEVDYNIHKSNSTYFADLDVSRTHLVGHLLARGLRAISSNASTKLVMDPSDPSRPARGAFGVVLGGVQCSFKKELKPYQRYEMWSRILSWDRKWLYIVTHYVDKGAVKSGAKPEDWEKKIHASAVSKYVFKIGRLTVHPAVLIEASGLLPERPGGWVKVENGLGEEPNGAAANGHAAPESAVWDWKRTEKERLKGLEYAEHLASLDGLLDQFEPGEDGPLGVFGPG
ncbi:capsule polysaccharide biosynthesis protein [Xylaria bambusicola]|uniref:capsule polysaccharide biosynthesis protein n=1 Tax=Xylaria bambusicola TaxID=326684 RepID=UPI002007E179|nr:capsule polysaccharide biosynthesis protein [Xylaria bambusicola]KAI0528309.1 capsule polysaccharide biosynthesis protein [Xylaria bambusicola]